MPGLPPRTVLDKDAETPLYRQLYDWLRKDIESGQLPVGSRLPATRAMAERLGVSRNTVLVAYEHLLADGYAEGRVGSGTRVAGRPEDAVHPPAKAERRRPLAQRLSAAGRAVLRAEHEFGDLAEARRDPTRPFTLDVPALDLFPTKIWGRLLATRAGRVDSLLAQQSPAGFWPLRQEIAAYLGLRYRIRCAPDQVIVTSSACATAGLLAKLLLDAGTPVLVEEPCRPAIRAAFAAAGFPTCPTPVDENGMIVGVCAGRFPGARMALATPHSQFPLGHVMSTARMAELLAWADRVDGWVIEDHDDPGSWSEPSAPTPCRFDDGGRVIHIGEFGQVLFPGLRIAWAVVPEELADVVTTAQRASVGVLPMLEQAALADLMSTNHFIRHLRRVSDAYGERREACVEAIRSCLGEDLAIRTSARGTHLILGLPGALLADEVVAAGRRSRVRAYALSQFYANPDGVPPSLVLGYGATPPDDLRAGVHRLCSVFNEIKQPTLT
jgi:GntR family transcriptional regulator/MocR family aminotransferase